MEITESLNLYYIVTEHGQSRVHKNLEDAFGDIHFHFRPHAPDHDVFIVDRSISGAVRRYIEKLNEERSAG